MSRMRRQSTGESDDGNKLEKAGFAQLFRLGRYAYLQGTSGGPFSIRVVGGFAAS
jgi:hypothetical protein